VRAGLKVCQGARYCLGAEGVLRVSLGCFVSLSQSIDRSIDQKKNSVLIDHHARVLAFLDDHDDAGRAIVTLDHG